LDGPENREQRKGQESTTNEKRTDRYLA
jgi:hypothetical protein